MIGVIVTGHGNFATGITSSLSLITGEHEAYKMIDFDGVISPDQLLEKIEFAINELENCESIYIFTDLLGGTPFRMAATSTLKHEKVHVFAGTNLAILIECLLTRDFQEDALAFANQLVESAKSQVLRYEPVTKEDDDSEEDGI